MQQGSETSVKKVFISLMGILLLLTSCAPDSKEEIVQKKDETDEEELSIVPSYRLADDNYKMILPFRPSKARGVVVNQVKNRIDIDEMEDGLRRHSTDLFNPQKYYFEEGQYLTEDMVYDWLGRYPTDSQLERKVKDEIARRKREKLNYNEESIRAGFQQGLNPALKDKAKKKDYEENPRYLSHILEQNYLEQKDDQTVELVGISIGLALKSVYKYKEDPDGPDYYKDIPEKEMLKEGKKIAEQVLERLRGIEGLEDVPIMIALYEEQEESSPIPGSFIAKTSVGKGSKSIDKWEATNEEYMLFPSSEAKKQYHDDYELIKGFGQSISEYFPNYVGYMGEGFYLNEELNKLSINIPLEFYGRAEVVGFTQYAYGLIKSIFPNHYDIEVKISSAGKLESLIYRESGEEDPTVHILH